MPSVVHRTVEVDGVRVFYREAGPADAPVVLLPHGYPSSSFQYRALMPALADNWRLIAPDFPGFGYSEAPEGFDYSFGAYADLLDKFVKELNVERFALYLFDYGSQVGFQLALKNPARITALVIQNGDAYEETLGPKYMPAESARAYLTDLPEAELHLLEGGGHWLLESHLDEVVALIRPFLSRWL